MAFLAIGLGIIGATYAWLPELVGKPLYSEAMARWHVWLTFVFATANSAVWLYQGLLGGPRRFAVLPHRYDDATQLSVPITIVLAAAQLLFAMEHRPDDPRQAAPRERPPGLAEGADRRDRRAGRGEPRRLGGRARRRARRTPSAVTTAPAAGDGERGRQDGLREHRLRRLPHARRRGQRPGRSGRTSTS